MKFNKRYAVHPGDFKMYDTERIRKEFLVEEIFVKDEIISRTPAGCWGQPEELQGTAIFLASKASDFVNGHILYVDGGILATIGKPPNK